jgi:hypothetical protein
MMQKSSLFTARPKLHVVRSSAPIQASTVRQFDVTNGLLKLVEHFGDSGRFQRMPYVAQSSVCDQVVALLKLVPRGERDAGWNFLKRFDFPHHQDLWGADTPPPRYRDWWDLSWFAHRHRIWQDRIYRASLTLRSSSCVASGTDELARLIARQVEREVDSATFLGQVYTAPRGRHGRPPAIEAAVAYGFESRVLMAMDGKEPVTEKDILKIANDCSAAARLYPEFRWVQPVLILPGGCDVRSDAVLKAALLHRVFIASTAVPTRPLGLTRRIGIRCR